jgi:hypothetical protein
MEGKSVNLAIKIGKTGAIFGQKWDFVSIME